MMLFLAIGQEPHGQPLGVGGGEDRGLQPDRLEVAEAAPNGAGVDGEVDIGGARIPCRPSSIHVSTWSRVRISFWSHNFDSGGEGSELKRRFGGG